MSFPLVCFVLMLFVHGTVECIPRTLREHRVTYQPARAHLADSVLTLRFAWEYLKMFWEALRRKIEVRINIDNSQATLRADRLMETSLRRK